MKFMKLRWLIAICTVVIVALFVACSLDQKVTAPVKTQEQDQSLAAAQAKAEMYESMIARMDKYVTTNKDGTYVLDYQGFSNAEGKSMTADEAKVAEDLNKGIPIVNEQVLQEGKNPGSTALGVSCWNYWWGRRCCYWGSSAEQAIQWLSDFGMLPVLGWVGQGWSSWANHLYIARGGFCTNMCWTGVCWMTAP